MFASEGDSVNVGRQGSTRWPDRWDDVPPQRPSGYEAAADVARRLRARLDRQLWLLDRMRTEQLYPEPAGLPDLLEASRRMQRDTESLLLLCGQERAIRDTAPRRLSDLLADAASAAEEPHRVDVRPAPAATVSAGAATELLHVLAELVEDVTVVYPGAHLDVASRIEARALVVDVSVDGGPHHDPDGLDGRGVAVVAEQLAQRSHYGISLHRPLAGPPRTGSGPVASVHCPPAAITVDEPAPLLSDPLLTIGNGIGSLGNGSMQLSNGSAQLSNGSAQLSNGSAQLSNGAGLADNGSGYFGNGSGYFGNGPGHPDVQPPVEPQEPLYSPSASSQVDELFGPLLDLPLEPIDERYATPIFEAIASAWFRDPEPAADLEERGGQTNGADPLNWESPNDSEWQAAAARAARSDPAPVTPSGLPRRRPGNQLVPPPRVQGTIPAGERVPDRVRERLTTYQRGLRQGRHRAPGSDEPDAW
jgi:X-X-X-Leu-X-X-Gly heptad repeat protein